MKKSIISLSTSIILATSALASTSVSALEVEGLSANVGVVSQYIFRGIVQTGTASASTFLRGDNAWAAAGGDNTPAFQAYLSANQTISNDTFTKLQCNTEDFDTASAYDNSTNYNFTVPSGEGGVYWLYMHYDYSADANSNAEYGAAYIAVNSEDNTDASFMNWWSLRSNPGRQMNLWVAGMRTLAAGDTVQFYVYGMDAISPGNWTVYGSVRRDTVVGGYKMLGIS